MKRAEENSDTGSKHRTLAIIVILLIGVLIGYYFVARQVLDREMATYEYAFETFIVNIAQTNAYRFLKCTISVDFDHKAGVSEAERKEPRLRDAIIDVLSSKTLEELEPGESRDELRSELLGAVDELMEKANVKRLFFSEFVIQ